MKTSLYHVIAQKDLRCRIRKFELHNGAMIFLRDASTPMIEWLQEVHINDTEALFGDTDRLMDIPTALTRPKVPSKPTDKPKRVKKQLFFKLRPPYDQE